MSDESVSATTTIRASADAVFAVLADPSSHSAIDGTGWVSEAVDPRPITESGQVFQMAMYHPNHPTGAYEILNLVVDFERPRAIEWKPGSLEVEGDGDLGFGGWTWRYDLVELGPDSTEVTHTYDWSGVGPGPREYIEFPPFPDDHLTNSLEHLARLVQRE